MKKLIGVTLVGLAVIGLLVHTSIQPAIPAAVPKEVVVVNTPLPSEILSLTSVVSTANVCGTGTMFREDRSDGTVAGADFNIPFGQVFVVTSFQWTGGGTAGEINFASLLRRQIGAPNLENFGPNLGALAGTNGILGATMTMPTGFVLDSDTDLCFNGPAESTGFAQGYLAPDN